MREIFRAAFVIGRRDFTAIIYSKAFIFFLLGPIFLLVVAGSAGLVGGEVAKNVERPVIGVAFSADEAAKLTEARAKLVEAMGERRFPVLETVALPASGKPLEAKSLLADSKQQFVAVLSGSLEKPVLTGPAGQVGDWSGAVSLMAGYAASGNAVSLPAVEASIVQQSAGDEKQIRRVTGQMAQTLLFTLTMLLAGMVLSNLVEEKSNKIIEILAASIPMESVFLGKLFAMLAMACIGILVWFSFGFAILTAFGGSLPPLPDPAVGWPIFLILGVIYFGLAYLMIGALFLGIGAMAATVREVQTLSMPATMGQLVIFFLSVFAVSKLDEPIGIFASIFPFSSPYVMISRAAQDPTLWHHGVAIVGQMLFAALVLRIGVHLFKRNVMKSGSGGKVKDDGAKRLFGLIKVRG